MPQNLDQSASIIRGNARAGLGMAMASRSERLRRIQQVIDNKIAENRAKKAEKHARHQRAERLGIMAGGAALGAVGGAVVGPSLGAATALSGAAVGASIGTGIASAATTGDVSPLVNTFGQLSERAVKTSPGISGIDPYQNAIFDFDTDIVDFLTAKTQQRGNDVEDQMSDLQQASTPVTQTNSSLPRTTQQSSLQEARR